MCSSRSDGELTLTALHPGVTVEQVRENTGWDLRVVDNVQVSEAPSAEELAALRELVRAMSTAENEMRYRGAGQEGVRQIYDPVADTPPRYRRDPAEAHPPLDYPPYKSTQLRHPKQPLVYLPHTVTEITGPQLDRGGAPEPTDSDLTIQHCGRADRRADHRLRSRVRHRGQAVA